MRSMDVRMLICLKPMFTLKSLISFNHLLLLTKPMPAKGSIGRGFGLCT